LALETLAFTLLAATVAVSGLYLKGSFLPREKHLKGSRFKKAMLTQEESEERRYLWGSMFMPFEQACKHFLAVGSTGSGKTVLITLLMKNVMRQICRPGSDARALVYDGKTDALATLRAMGVPEDRILVLNPFDSRAVAWNMAQDIRDSSQADDVATVFIPSTGKETNPYFTETARRFLAGIIEAFIEHSGERWNLRDLILASKTVERLKAILGSSSETEDLLDHFEPADTFRNVKSTMDGHLRGYRAIAATWHKSKRPSFSIAQWMNSQSVLVLGNSPKAKAPIQRLNSLIFTEIGKAILGRPGRSTAENWMFLDEFGDLGELANLVDLMKLGRSKGAAIVLGTQDIQDIDAIYNRDRSRALLGCAQNLGIVHINSSQPDTQKWASEVLGEHFIRRTEKGSSVSVTPAQTSHTNSTSDRYVTEKIWMPSQFSSDLPPTSRETGLTGVFRIGNAFYNQNIPGEILFGDKGKWNRVPRPDPSYPDFLPNEDPDALRLGDWDESDFARLAVPGLREAVLNSEPAAPSSSGRDLLADHFLKKHAP